VNVLRGERIGTGRRVAIVASRFNELVTAKLVDGACGGLSHHGVTPEDVTVAWVPGAFEIPLVALRLAESGRFDALICLGAVIRGETAHFDLIAAEAARGISEVGWRTGVPCIFEVLATDDLGQALARAGGEHGNKGWDAAGSALEMASLLRALPVGNAG
jgi:6,7-dimethyl-8-ribityllumazine synthase